MLNKLNQLSFVIGVFFTILSIILFVNMLIRGIGGALSIYSATTFLVFGLVMMLSAKGKIKT